MFTVQQVAEALGTTDDHILDLIHSRRLHAINIGLGSKRPRWRVSAESLEEFKLARTATSPAPRAARRKKPDNVIAFYS